MENGIEVPEKIRARTTIFLYLKVQRELVAHVCLTHCDPMDCNARLLCPWNSPGKNTRMGSHSFLQEIFLTQGSNPGFLYHRQIFFFFLPSETPGSPFFRLYNLAISLLGI